MTTLRALWEVSLTLCLVAVLALLVLLSARMIAARLGDRRSGARTRLLTILLDAEPSSLSPISGLELQVAADLTVELAEMTRGSECDVLLARASALGVSDLLVRQLRSHSAQKRLSAVEALAMFDDRREQTVRVLDDPNPDVRLGAALALAQRGSAPDPLTVVHKLKVGEEENSLLLVSLMKDLAETDPESVAGLLFEKDLSYRAKVAAMDALADRGGEYAPMLAYMARDCADEPELQPRIYRALGRMGHPAGAVAIIEGLASDHWTVRGAAAEAAGKAGLAQAADELAGLLDDPNYWVRYRASEALLRLGPRGINALRKASESDDKVVSGVATKMLSEGRAA